MQGLHLSAEFHGCDPAVPLMHDAQALQSRCAAIVDAVGLHCVGAAFHAFATLRAPGGTEGPGGVTGVLLLAESHLALHTWPELGVVTLDVYVCNVQEDRSGAAHAVLQMLEADFAPQRVTRRSVERGDLRPRAS